MNFSFPKVAASPLNKSPSKQLYSFTKASRFQSKNPPMCDQFYNLNSSFDSKKIASFGYGNKIDFINRNNVPGAGRYQTFSDFQINYKQKKGFKFGTQQKMIPTDTKRKGYIPGPGSYNGKHQYKYTHLSYSLYGKPKQLSPQSTKLGPGQYQNINFNSKGNYYVSKYESSKCGKIGNSLRFNERKIQTPGPGSYRASQKQDINKFGVYFDSKIRSNAVRTFSKSKRPSIALNRTLSPGPGAYQQFSEFAIRNKSSFELH